MVSAILDTVGALVIVLDPEAASFGSTAPANSTTGYALRGSPRQTYLGLFLQRKKLSEFARSFATQAPTCCHRTMKAIG